MSTRRRPVTEDKLEALHYQLIEAVADLATSEGWQHMLAVAARFHAYSSGGPAVFELRECGWTSVSVTAGPTATRSPLDRHTTP